MTVKATAKSGFIFPATVTGWTVSSDRMTATAPVVLEPNPCDAPASTEVTPGEVTVVQGSCPAPGRPIHPSVTLPETEGVSYSLAGDVVPGAIVSVTAEAQTSFIFPESVTGWIVSSDRMSATQAIRLDQNPCDPVVDIKSVAPVAPKFVEATCAAGPSVTLAKTEGILYTLTPQNPKAGDKVTVTAKALDGFKLVAADGWTLDEEAGIATWSKNLAAAPTNCSAADLATTGANSTVLSILGASVILLGAGGFITYRRWRLQ